MIDILAPGFGITLINCLGSLFYFDKALEYVTLKICISAAQYMYSM